MDAPSPLPAYEPGKQIGICLDVASLSSTTRRLASTASTVEERDSPTCSTTRTSSTSTIVSIEDPFNEEGEDWAAITARLGDRLQFVGDDLLVTNPARLQKAIDLGAANSCWSS